jgi:hypothetical protein
MRPTHITYAAPPAGVRRALAGLLAVAALAGGAILLAASPASATLTHKYLSQLTGVSDPTGVAFDGSAGSTKGDVYVANYTTTVDRFTSAGAPAVFSASGGYIEGSKLTGTPTGAGGAVVPFVDPEGVAVDDATGDVYVADGLGIFGSGGPNVVDVFSPSGEYLSRITEVPASSGATVNGRFEELGGLTFDQAKEELYVADRRVVDVFSAAGVYVSQLGNGVLNPGMVLNPGEFPNTVAVNEFTGDVYVGDPRAARSGVFPRTPVEILEPLGGVTEWTGAGTQTHSFGNTRVFVAVDQANDHVYATSPEAGVVDELGSSTSEQYIYSLTGTPAGAFGGVSSVAVDPETGDLYVGSGGVVDIFGPDLVIPTVEKREASDVTSSSAVLNGTVNPEEGGAATCEFEYGTSTSYGEHAKCEGEGESKANPVKNGPNPVPVHSVAITGLPPDTTYYYRLDATNAAELTNRGTGSEDEGHFTTKGPGFVGLASATKVTATSALLDATINPDNAPTSYHFEYDTKPYAVGQAAHGTAVPIPDQSIGSAQGGQQVQQPIQGLTPGTVYYYRVAVQSEVEPGKIEVFDGNEATFTTQGPAAVGLPDGREWEMVSPPAKDGALIEPPLESRAGVQNVIQAAADGERFGYTTSSPTEGQPRGTGPDTQVLSTRTVAGWQSRDLTLPHLGATSQSVNNGGEYRFFSEDLSYAVVQPFGAFDPALSAEASEATAFLHTNYAGGEVCADGCYRPLVTGEEGFANVPPGTRFGQISFEGDDKGGHPCPPALMCGPKFVGASGDAQHVVLASGVALTETAIPKEQTGSLYEWDAATGRLALLSVLPAGEGGVPVAGASLGSFNSTDARNAISSNGSRVFFGVGNKGLYMREPGGGPAGAGVTLRLDLPQAGCATCGKGFASAVFQDASVSGSRVWFTDEQRLTANADTTPGSSDLYECAIALEASGEPVCKLSNLGGGSVVGASEDGSYVYVAGGRGLELHHYDSEPGHEGWEAPQFIAAGAEGIDSLDLSNMTARVSPNGQWLAFMSSASLTGYDNEDVSSSKPGERMDREVFVYHAGSGGASSLSCASCNPTGARPIGSARVPGWTPFQLGTARYQTRYLSDSGRVFFDARDPLVPQAVNENWDVYEWEPAGVPAGSHSCSSSTNGFVASSGGCVGLISSGESPDESVFLDADEGGGEGEHGKPGTEAGGDVFFMTTAKLAPQDVDDSYDVYDAHECTTASPCLPTRPVTPPECTSADACRAAQSPQPAVFGAPASATFNGVGNLVGGREPNPPVVKKVTKKTAKCAKGKTRNKHGACVKKPKKKSKAKKTNRRAK